MIASLCLLALVLPAGAQNLYDEDLAWHLANPGDIRRATGIKARLRQEEKEADALFVLTPLPFKEIDVAPNTQKTAPKPRVWSLPPWPTLDPALPEDMPESARKILEERRKANEAAEVWGEVPVAGGELETISVLLRPRVIPLEDEFVFKTKEIPKPFSLRRYYDQPAAFVQVAAYGGTSSFKAEEAFRAIKQAATRQKQIEGIGAEAFLTRVIITEELPEKPEEDPLPEAPPFGDLDPLERARPDLADSAKAVALMAPAFRQIEVADLVGKHVQYPTGPKKYKNEVAEVKNSLMVLVAFFPDQALTVSFALEERLGNVQDLIALALMSQRKLLDMTEKG